MTDALLEREKGALPVSIGTSLALESSFGILPEHETDSPFISEYDTIWFNVRTVFRNLVGSVSSDDHARLKPNDVAETLSSEMQVIESAIGQQTAGRVETVFYLPSYRSAARRYPTGKHRVPSTDLQKFAWNLEKDSLDLLKVERPPVDMREYDFDIESNASLRTLMVTHYPVDLFNRYQFKSLALLESHTGALKPPSLWYTKLKTLDRDFINMPFDSMTLQIFGDGTMFAPMPLKIRRHLIDVAKRNKWSTVTTKDKIIRDIRLERDPIFEGFIMKLYR